MRAILFSITLFFVLASSAFAGQVLVQIKDEMNNQVLGTATAYITLTQKNPETYIVDVQGQQYEVNGIENFLGTATSYVELANAQGGIMFLDGKSVESQGTSSGTFSRMTYDITVPADTTQARVKYKIIASGNFPASSPYISTSLVGEQLAVFPIEITETKTRTEDLANETPAEPKNPEKECQCTCYEVCQRKKIPDCPAVQRYDGKVSQYGTSGKITGGYWKGGVAVNEDGFVGDCAGCADIQKPVIKAVNCNEACRTTCETIRPQAETTAAAAAKACYDFFADGCATVLPSQQSQSSDTSDEQSINQQNNEQKNNEQKKELPAQKNMLVQLWTAITSWFASFF